MAENCLYIGTVLPFRRKSISVILGTVKTLHSSRSGLEWLFSISVKVVVSILFQKARRVLNNERGEANYFSTVVFIFIAVLLLAFIIDLFSIISTKQELDHAADQMVKQIQLSGGVNSETDELFEFLSSQIEGAENISYSIDATYTSPRPSGMTNWFHTLIFTTPGKIALAICAAIILFALTQIMKLSKPIEYGGDSV